MKLYNPPLILASQSPRRRNLLEEHQYAFEVLAPDPNVEGRLCSGCSPDEMVVEWAVLKAADVAWKTRQFAEKNRNSSNANPAAASMFGTILAADTIAELDGQIIGKPRDEEDAERMLRMLMGRDHRCLTGVCVWDLETNLFVKKIAVSQLRMQKLTDQQLNDYLNTDGWVGKAGAFGYQDGPDWLELLSGLATTVVGLPMELLPEYFQELADRIQASGSEN